MKNLIITATVLLSTLSFCQSIKFTENELYPEGITYSHKAKSFFVSSLHYGKIGKVDWKGNYTNFVNDAQSISAIGILADEKRNLLYVAISDPGVSVKTATTDTFEFPPNPLVINCTNVSMVTGAGMLEVDS